MKRTFNHLSHKERIVIETLLAEKKSVSYIARQLGRNRSTIGREVKQWVVNPKDVYKADLAHFCAEQVHITKRGKDKINSHSRLKAAVYRGLLRDLSPEQISGELRDRYPADPVMSISYEAIYQHIYRHRQSRLGKKLIALLPYKHSRRRNRTRKGFTKHSRIPEAVSIDERPAEVLLRQEIGHTEG
ncbi:helix-turn-helix domain-containing protein, partial [Flavobacterium selenitireducens]|uniref:helix-turn-helix domain-containing protein n=1 Tax=Flavobacterium selenitireducens TaxID=2722704 RepID=UPI00168A6743